MTKLEDLRAYVREILMIEYVVPKGFSLERWKVYRKKNKVTNKEYSKTNPGARWKIVHGHKKGEVGEPLPGMDDMSYEKATKTHTAIAMN